ncbi:YtfJ family protein [Flammeovirga kamogawensis]|uniref:YtfJ family protein n=1 Tax=Flammeovirga kamogawensis TaxID=373891 RepID=A0ABX8H147_9BACT|nr:YtfJ family protein [Flammeovirga kamogawensis]MBB6462646.1 hypothetical protein [Flammeovirga kamogawensis]QWG09610.1 YtfJ family protein [Flammeovirga kamogawensis]TRX65124.1 hypothetical protein EO216_21590 [Flammeovirga kamogawensis]
MLFNFNHYKAFILLLFFVLFFSETKAQSKTPANRFLQRGDTLAPIELRDLKNKPFTTPGIGEKVLLIFYPDPDNPHQNDYFVEQSKQWKFPLDEFLAYGIVNLKDTPYPNPVIRFMLRMLRKRSKREANALVLTDPKGTLQKEWNTGDCNNAITILVVDKTGEVLFFKAGKLDEQETAFVIKEICDHLTTAHKMTPEEMKEFELDE